MQVAEQVYKNETLQKTAAAVYQNDTLQRTAARVTGAVAGAGAQVNQLKTTITTTVGQVGELTTERRKQYSGWVMEKMATPGAGAAAAVGFFLARKSDGQESAFETCRKQERVEVVDISARNFITTTLVVQAGDTLNWTFGPLLFDILPNLRSYFLCCLVVKYTLVLAACVGMALCRVV